ncbi:MAG: biotin transporter BioY [Elusimicrobiota bacterium]
MTAIAQTLNWTSVRLPWPARVGLAFGMACLTGLMAQVRIPLPFTPVPLTGQVFAVLAAGALLGARFGALSQLMYIGLGCSGMSWFAGFSCGIPTLFGPTGGYLLGFVLAAHLVGTLSRLPSLRKPVPLFCVMVCGVAAIHLAGAVQFAAFMGTGLQATLAGAVLPFIGVDLVKAAAAAGLGWALLPRE